MKLWGPHNHLEKWKILSKREKIPHSKLLSDLDYISWLECGANSAKVMGLIPFI